MKLQIKEVNLGQLIIERLGYVYAVESIHDQYVGIGNGEYVMHHDYKILSGDIDKSDIDELAEVIEVFYKKYGQEESEEILTRLVTRINCIEDGRYGEPRHICTFEEFEGDSKNVYQGETS